MRVRRSNDYVVERMTFSTVRCWHGFGEYSASISHVTLCTMSQALAARFQSHHCRIHACMFNAIC